MTDTAFVPTITQAQMDRHAAGVAKVIGETVQCEKIGAMIYTFGSELAVLKVFRMYNMVEGHPIKGRIGKSHARGHYFSFESKF